jgi:MFS family permease
VGLFLVESILSGLSSTMLQLIVMRAVQGAGAGANFALAYIMVAEISTPDQRERRMGYISFAMFALLAFLPLFIQGVLGMSAVKTGMFMVPVSVGWSAGGLLGGQLINRLGNKVLSAVGSLFMLAGSVLTLGFGPDVGLLYYEFVVSMIGVGMGFVTVGTLIAVQESLSHQRLVLLRPAQRAGSSINRL